MALNDFKDMVENARKIKGYSQREFAKMMGITPAEATLMGIWVL